jgi:hypothetical protein
MSDATAVGELIGFGLDPRLSPGRNARYAELVTFYRNDDRFRAAIEETAAGQGLSILDCSPLYGLVLAASGPESPYAMRLDDYAAMTTDERHLNALVFLAIATACYPTAAELEVDDSRLRSVSVQSVVRLVLQVAERIAEQAGDADPPVDEPQLEPLYRLVLRWRVSDTTEDARSNPKVLTGMVRRALKWFVANGFADEVTTARDTYRMRSRFRLHVLDAVGDVGDSLAHIRDLAAVETS